MRALTITLLILLLTGCAGKAPNQEEKVKFEEAIGLFYSGMSYSNVQEVLQNEGKPFFKAAHENSNYVLILYDFKHFSESHIFVFKDLELIAIMDKKIFFKAWDNFLHAESEKKFVPFETGVSHLYDELAMMKDQMMYGEFKDVKISHSRMVPKKYPSDTGGIVQVVYGVLILPVAAPAVLVGIILQPLEKFNDERKKELFNSIKNLQVGDNYQDLENLKYMEKANSEYGNYEVYKYVAPGYPHGEVLGYFGLREGRVEWVSTFDSKLMRQKFNLHREFW